MPQGAQQRALIAQLARQRGLDPHAVLAVASVEGGFNGAVGDGGTSFGPFQQHWGGAMPKKFVGNAKASHAWANSRAGISAALDGMVSVGARGLTGKAAIDRIVRGYERPAAPGAEVEKAFGRYGSLGFGPFGKPPAPGGNSPVAQLTGASTQSMLAAQMLHQASQTVGGQLGDPSSIMAMALMRQQAEAAAQEYGPAPQEGVPLTSTGKAGLPLGTPMGGKSEFGIVDAEGAPGPGGRRFHAGKDWFAPAGSSVTAPWGGKVVEVKQSRGNSGQVFGGTVKIQGADGRVFVARHVDPKKFKVGQSVKPGQAVAAVSPWTGGSPHAHIEIWKSLAGGYRYENMIDPVRVFGGG